MDGRRNNGGHPNSGRKPKDAEQKAIELLKDHDEVWASRLKDAVSEGKNWALKLYAEYRFSKPVQTTDITIGEVLKPDWIEDI
jgi:hypothetical protein